MSDDSHLLRHLLALVGIHLSPEGPCNAALEPVGIDLLYPQPFVSGLFAGLHIQVGAYLSGDARVLLACRGQWVSVAEEGIVDLAFIQTQFKVL